MASVLEELKICAETYRLHTNNKVDNISNDERWSEGVILVGTIDEILGWRVVRRLRHKIYFSVFVVAVLIISKGKRLHDDSSNLNLYRILRSVDSMIYVLSLGTFLFVDYSSLFRRRLDARDPCYPHLLVFADLSIGGS